MLLVLLDRNRSAESVRAGAQCRSTLLLCRHGAFIAAATLDPPSGVVPLPILELVGFVVEAEELPLPEA